MPYTLNLAAKGLRTAMADDPGLLEGLNTYAGKITCRPVAESQSREYSDPTELLAAG